MLSTPFGLNGKIWNSFTAEEYLGDKGWKKTGAETIPPIIARGVLLDVASAKGSLQKTIYLLAERCNVHRTGVPLKTIYG